MKRSRKMNKDKALAIIADMQKHTALAQAEVLKQIKISEDKVKEYEEQKNEKEI